MNESLTPAEEPGDASQRVRHVRLVAELERSYQRDLARGAGQYAAARRGWLLHGLTEPAGGPCDGVLSFVSPWSPHVEGSPGGVPMVFTSDADVADGPVAVVPDNRKVGRLAAEHLLMQGGGRFAYVGLDRPFSRKRRDGFFEALGEAGVSDVCELSQAEWGPWLERQGAADDVGGGPIAVLGANDTTAVNVMRTCHEAGWAVPDRVMVMGVDDDDVMCSVVRPTLTSINLNLRRVGHAAAATLDGLMNGHPPPQRITPIEPAGVVRRGSTEFVPSDDPILAAALRMIRDPSQIDITIDRILEAVPISRRGLEQRFQKRLGHTPYAEIQSVRLNRAKQLLQQTDLPIARVSTLAGFGDSRHFSTTFRKKLGCTPTAFRRQQRFLAPETLHEP